MASKHALRGVLRSTRQLSACARPSSCRSFATAPRSIATSPAAICRARPSSQSVSTRYSCQGVRWSSESATGSKIYDFEEIKTLSQTSESPIQIIDVREPGELASTGRIPGAKNIPITTSPDSFHITAEEFEDRFGFERPPPGDEVVFYCKAGVRSRAAAGIAREAGWSKVGEYPGSWADWTGKGGKIERS
ncbi:Thiosulfate sulfurtransferase rdl2, mitochondrial [Pestalotiopsis sp. IQ-011]